MSYMSNKGADQPAHPRSPISTFVVHYRDSIIPIAAIAIFPRLFLASIAEQAGLIWRVEKVIILFCYSICNSSIYILVFNIFVTFTILILSF